METKRLFVAGLPWDYDWQELKELFNEYWEVTYVRVMKDRDTQKSRWFGFVEFSDIENSKRAKDELDWKRLDWRVLKVDFATSNDKFSKKEDNA
jgi:nucleolin